MKLYRNNTDSNNNAGSDNNTEDAVANAKTLVGTSAAVLKVFAFSLPEADYSADVDVTINVPDVVAGAGVVAGSKLKTE